IVTSATYRQSSATTPEHYRRDPDNRLLARGPRFRLPAEQIRDNALAISGLLYRKYGGPSIYPYQPEGLLEEKGQLQYHPVWITSSNPDQYRRGLYVYWKRMNLYPSLAAFGAPTRQRCSVYRPITNTPMQALVLLNDPVFVDAARAFAVKIMTTGGTGQRERINQAMLLCLGRPATEDEISRYSAFIDRQQTHYHSDTEAAAKLTAGSHGQIDIAELAAWTTLSSVLLNLDETMTKE
ncbi:MAG: DUF1553 domain-containing protein, partial [Planctomycetales bacterium]